METHQIIWQGQLLALQVEMNGMVAENLHWSQYDEPIPHRKEQFDLVRAEIEDVIQDMRRWG